jgi:hypothetical protein
LSFLLALLAISVHSDFEGGNIGKVDRLTETHLQCAVPGESDQDKRNRQANWYYFRVDGARGQEVTVDLVNLPGEYNYASNQGAVTKDTIPVYSEDGVHWQHFAAVHYDAGTPLLRLRFTPKSDRFWIAHVPPYTNRDLARLLKEHHGSPFLRTTAVGKSAGNRDIQLLTITDPSAAETQKRVVWLMFRQHSWEAGSSWAGEGAIRFLLSPEAEALRRNTIFKIFPLCDPDGVSRGGVRFNLYGYDLNRNWDIADPKRMPEITAQRKAILEWVDSGKRIDIFLSLHNTETSEYLDGPPSTAGPLTNRLFQALVEKTTFAPSRPPRPMETTTTPGKPGRMTVIQGLYHDRKINAFLMEQRISFNPKLGRLPTVADRLAFGAALARVVAEAAQQ